MRIMRDGVAVLAMGVLACTVGGQTAADSQFTIWRFDNIDSIDTISRYVLRRLEGGRQKTTAGVEKR